MSWQQFSVARQLVAEERLGTRVREAAAREDDAFARAATALRRR